MYLSSALVNILLLADHFTKSHFCGVLHNTAWPTNPFFLVRREKGRVPGTVRPIDLIVGVNGFMAEILSLQILSENAKLPRNKSFVGFSIRPFKRGKQFFLGQFHKKTFRNKNA